MLDVLRNRSRIQGDLPHIVSRQVLWLLEDLEAAFRPAFTKLQGVEDLEPSTSWNNPTYELARHLTLWAMSNKLSVS